MKDIIASDIQVLDNLMEFELDGKKIDLHNDSVFNGLNYDKARETLFLVFFNEKYKVYIKVEFIDAELNVVNFFEMREGENTLDTFYKGRFELDGKLMDSVNGKGYFYLSFVGEGKIELFARSVIIGDNPKSPGYYKPGGSGAYSRKVEYSYRERKSQTQKGNPPSNNPYPLAR